MNWIKEREQKTTDLKLHAQDLQKKLDFAVSKLEKLSTGHGFHQKDRSPELGMGMLAASALSELSKMSQRPKPFIWWA